MKTSIHFTLALPLLILFGGCTSSDYASQRRRDALDIFTLTIGAGSGLKARVGPIQPALFQTADMSGLRAGQWLANGNLLTDNNDATGPFPILTKPQYGDVFVRESFTKGDHKVSHFRPSEVIPYSRPHTTFWGSAFGHEIFSHGPDSISHARGKDIFATSPYPFYIHGQPASYYTQIEVAGGLGMALRLGFNVGELVDFIIGFSGADLYRDDYIPAAAEPLEQAPRGRRKPMTSP
jgi:hypothetical protein